MGWFRDFMDAGAYILYGVDAKKARQEKAQRGGWSPRVTGTTEDDREVTLREGLGDNEGHTLIADGQQSDRSFRRGHNHYGPKREGRGRVEDDGGDRGRYTGPGH